MKKQFTFVKDPFQHDDLVWMLEGIGEGREAFICNEKLMEWFDVPKECTEIRVTVSGEKLDTGYKCRFTRNYMEARLGQNEIFDESARKWTDETLTCGVDCLLMDTFRPGLKLQFIYWASVDTLDGT